MVQRISDSETEHIGFEAILDQTGDCASQAVTLVLTRFEKPIEDGAMTKTIELGGEGFPVSDGSGCRMWRGTAETIGAKGAEGLAQAINACTSNQAFSMGIAKKEHRRPGIDDFGRTLNVVTKDAVAGKTPGTIARSKEYFQFADGRPAPMLLDHDRKGMPDRVAGAIGQGGFWGAVLDVAPELRGAARVMRASTSAGLLNARTGKSFPGSGGLHVYLFVKDGSDIPRALAVLDDRATLKGYGWGWISKAGSILQRSIVDASKGAPNDLSFEGPPIVKPPLKQDLHARLAVANEGKIVDTRSAFPDLSVAERLKLKTIRDAERQRLDEAAREIRGVKIKEQIKRARKDGSKLSDESLRERFEEAYGGRLPPDFILTFDDPAIGEVNVAAVLSDRPRYGGETLADPLEGIGYGQCKAKVLTDGDDGWVRIHSFAHGGGTYVLLIDQAALRQMIADAPADQAIEVFVHNIDRATLFPGGEDDLIKICMEKSGAGKRTIQRALQAERAKREKKKSRMRAAKRAAMDSRPAIPAPAGDAELDAFATTVETLLAISTQPVPAFRGLNGKLAVLVEEPVSGFHLLESATVNGMDAGAEAKKRTQWKAPPPETRVVELTQWSSVAMELERHLRLIRTRANGDVAFVRADATIYEAINNRLGRSGLKTVKAAQTLPIVLPKADGTFELVMDEGIDERLGVYVRVPSEIRAGTLDPAKATLADGKRAYQFLADEWLVDVEGDNDAKAVLISIALTLIQRMLFKERPGFMVTGPVAGAGKTTVISMVSMAITGHRAAAAAWAEHEDEIRKALFAHLSAGPSLIVWDNIKRLTRISSPTVEKSLTAEFLEDRVLGHSVIAKAPAHAVQVWTGNDIGPKNEMASRAIVAKLRAQRPDPENRDFAHPDPYGWTLAHRAKILAAMYTILCVPRQPATAKTRMKDWWTSVGRPLELVSGEDFEKIVKSNSVADTTLGALEIVVSWLFDTFGTRNFTAQEAAEVLRTEIFGTEDEREARQAVVDARRDALAELSGTRFPPIGNPSAHAVGKKLACLNGRPYEVDGKTLTMVVTRRHQQNQYQMLAG